ncbi:hypothetical protein B0H14DRAFT_2628497 [Mycena olivaceomarginata]|nr:hypothetical protein B0H14DRAFT_2628497 [Mycena olivaceomarginata]
MSVAGGSVCCNKKQVRRVSLTQAAESGQLEYKVAGRWISPQGYQESTAGGSGCRDRMWFLRVEPTARKVGAQVDFTAASKNVVAAGRTNGQKKFGVQVDFTAASKVDLTAGVRREHGRWIWLLSQNVVAAGRTNSQNKVGAQVDFTARHEASMAGGSRRETQSGVAKCAQQVDFAARSRPKTKKQRHKTAVDNVNMQEQARSWDSAGADLDMGSEPGWSSPERPPQSSETDVPQDFHGAGYSEYCERKISKTHRPPGTTFSEPLSGTLWLLSFLLDYGEELFPSNTTFTTDGSQDTEAVLFSRQELQEDVYLNHFSSTSPNSQVRRLIRHVITGTPLTMEALKKGAHPRVGRDTDEAGADEEDDEDEDEETGGRFSNSGIVPFSTSCSPSSGGIGGASEHHPDRNRGTE